jgi:hypothetical protein
MTLLESLGEEVLVQIHGYPCDVLIYADCVTAVSAYIKSSGNDWRIPQTYSHQSRKGGGNGVSRWYSWLFVRIGWRAGLPSWYDGASNASELYVAASKRKTEGRGFRRKDLVATDDRRQG